MNATATKESAKSFAIGDKARLNSGGPIMTVIGISPSGKIWCQWEQSDGEIDDASFDKAMLIYLDSTSESVKLTFLKLSLSVEPLANGDLD